ncbi:nitroreductase/quinone reductase family protein [Actinomycetota bacterium]
MRNIGWRVDKTLLRMSRGRVDLAGPDIPLMLLTTPGRKSGKQRTVPLAYVRDGDNVAVACENFGLEMRAAWPGNALASSVVVIEIDGLSEHRRAREATPAELARIVPALTRIWPAHDTYMARTGHRQVIVFEPTYHTR